MPRHGGHRSGGHHGTWSNAASRHVHPFHGHHTMNFHHSRHSTSHYDAELQLVNQMILLKDAVYVLKSAGTDSPIGCPVCCPGGSITCSVNKQFLPDELNGIMTKEELQEFTSALDEVFDKTHWPIIPCIFAHFCIPFSPICAMFYCDGERTKQATAIIESANSKLMERGYYWETVHVPGVIAQLKVNKAANERYLATSGSGGDMVNSSSLAPFTGTANTTEVVYATVISTSSTEASAPPPVTEMVMVRHVEADNSTDKSNSCGMI